VGPTEFEILAMDIYFGGFIFSEAMSKFYS
jgi:hypothetical protein